MTFEFSARLAERGFDVSLDLTAGETVAILGPNGAGKSTLLSLVAGLLRPDDGRARLDGNVLFEVGPGTPAWTPPHRRGTALLAQDPLLFPHLNVLDNVAFGPRSAGQTRRASRDAARRWLGEVDAVELAHRRPGQLSGGQAQRVAVARALAAGPELLLLDEPMAALDIHAAPMLRSLFKRVLAGRRALIITHDVIDALTLADRVVVLEDGHIAEEGPTRQVLQQPRSRFAAGLAGLNLHVGQVVDDGLRTPDGLHVAGHLDPEAVPGQAGVALFPPSAVSIFLQEPHGSPRNVFPAVIEHLEPHGDQFRVSAAGFLADVTPAAVADLGLAPGSRAYFVVKAASVSVYPA